MNEDPIKPKILKFVGTKMGRETVYNMMPK